MHVKGFDEHDRNVKIVYMKSLSEMKNCNDYDHQSSHDYKIWSIGRGKHVNFTDKVMDNYFGTGREVQVKLRDTKNGIGCYRAEFYIDQMHHVYDWMFTDNPGFVFDDDDFLI